MKHLTLQEKLSIRLQHVSILCQPLCMVLSSIQNVVYHRRRDVQSTHHAMQDSHLRNFRELVEITRVVIVPTRTCIQ